MTLEPEVFVHNTVFKLPEIEEQPNMYLRHMDCKQAGEGHESLHLYVGQPSTTKVGDAYLVFHTNDICDESHNKEFFLEHKERLSALPANIKKLLPKK